MSEVDRLLNRSEDYIENHLDERIKLKDLAEYCQLSAYHYHRIFKKATHESVLQFVSRIKMERSAIFLYVYDSISITEIAQRYGYGDASAYCKAFKKHFGKSPSQFRKARLDKKTEG